MGGITDGPFKRASEYDIKLEQLRARVYQSLPSLPEREWLEHCDEIMRLVYSLVAVARWDEQFEETCMPEYNEVNQTYAKRLIWSRRERLEELREIISRLLRTL